MQCFIGVRTIVYEVLANKVTAMLLIFAKSALFLKFNHQHLKP